MQLHAELSDDEVERKREAKEKQSAYTYVLIQSFVSSPGHVLIGPADWIPIQEKNTPIQGKIHQFSRKIHKFR